MSDDHPSSQIPRRRASDRKPSPNAALSSSVALVTIGKESSGHQDIVDAVQLRSVRQDPSFVTHLIAMAERCPQTRVLRRASPQDAMAAYRSVGATPHSPPVGGRTRQDI